MLLALVIAAAPALEVALFPVTPRLGEHQARQYSVAADLNVALGPIFALTLRGQSDYAPLARDESDPCASTPCRARIPPANGLFVTGAAFVGFEISPELAEAVLFDLPVRIDAISATAVGGAATRRELAPATDMAPARFGDTGWRFAGQVGGGLRVRIASWLAVRAEVRSLLMSSSVNSVNGCSSTDLEALDAANRAGRPVSGATVGSTCRSASFATVDIPAASRLTTRPGSHHSHGHLLAIVQAHVGIALTF